MKKFFLILVATIGLAISTNAQVCNISGDSDGGTVEVQSCYIQGDKVIVNLINDSKDIAANVEVTVKVTYTNYGYSETKDYKGKGTSIARVPLQIEIPISSTYPGKDNYVATSVIVTGVTGSKCN